MLLLENGSSKLERIQGAFISDEEVTNLTSTLKSSRKVKYRDEFLWKHRKMMSMWILTLKMR